MMLEFEDQTEMFQSLKNKIMETLEAFCSGGGGQAKNTPR